MNFHVLNSVLKWCGVSLLFLSSSVSLAGFNKNKLDSLFSSAKSSDHGVMFTRISDGQILYQKNPDQLLSPASLTKIITSAASLAYFGPSYSFKTPIYYSGNITGGRLKGDLYIVGNGDPFLVSEILWQTAVDLRHHGIKAIDGDIVIDNSLFDRESRDESRQDSAKFSTHAYDAPISAFAINFNTMALAIAPSVTLKQPAFVSLSPFPMKSVRISGSVATTPGSSSSEVYASRTSEKNGAIRLTTNGTIGIDAPIKKIYRSVGEPDVAAGEYILGFLADAGIKVVGRSRVGILRTGSPHLYDIVGYEMRRIAAGLNTFSNNFIADILTKRLGAAFGDPSSPDKPGSGTLANGVKVITQFLRNDLGIKEEFKLLNGSGLSIENRLTAKQLMTVLSWMEKQGELFPDFLGSLPASGWDGTLKKRMNKATPLTGLIRAKTGTLTEPITVSSMAGYFRHPSEGWVSFVILSNGRLGASQPGLAQLRKIQEDVLNSLL